MNTDRETAFVLHARPYRETSSLVDLFTRQYGRLRLVAKGVRGRSGTKGSRQLPPFVPMQVAWSGRGALKNLRSAEPLAAAPFLQGERLFSGLYLNELLIRLLAEHDPHEVLFEHYQHTIAALNSGAALEPALRVFELRLLDEIGYQLVLDVDMESGEPVSAEANYWYDPQQGGMVFSPLTPADSRGAANLFSGRVLLAIAEREVISPDVLRDAKRLLRLALKPHLGERPLQSRKLFQNYS